MGNKCSPCCAGYSKVRDTDDSDDERTSLTGSGKSSEDKYGFEQRLLDDTVMKSGHVSYAAIVSYSNGTVRATAPKSFVPDKKGIKNILRALKDIDTTGLADNGINLGCGSRVSTPGKLDVGKAIYGSDAQGGGCAIFKAKSSVLIVIYEKEPAAATRLANEVAEYMADQEH